MRAAIGLGGDNWGVRELPTGTVTLLFSDIEGSTVLLSRLGGLYGEALSAQRVVLRTAIAEGRGMELGTEGDSFFVVFSSAADAVGCCVAAQRALGRYDWPGGAAVRVRMGLHTGEPSRHEDGYIGLDVHRAARIAAAAHGGQVVMSQVTWQLAQPGLPADLSVRDLGLHRLKDIEEPERIVQLAGPGLAAEFPPLKSLGALTSLPEPPTPLVGRDSDLEQVRAVISRPGMRLVTLTGTGGVGKTRLALAAAASLGGAFPDGVFFVALAAVRDAGVMWKAIAEVLDSGGGEPGAVCDYLSDRQALLVLDNLEQLDGAAKVVAALLVAAPGVVVLATSRRPLHLQQEHELPVPPLELPGETGVPEVTASGAARLFGDRGQRRRHRGDLPAPGRAAAGHRAGRLPGQAAVPQGHLGPAGPRPGPGRGRPPATLAATDATGHHRLELWPTRSGRRAGVPGGRGIRRGLRPGCLGGGRRDR
jgi:class 3 adenylate cyclase